ncbi:hypothetical protein ACSS6W_003449 [Trichoderma asperelloides]
MMTRRRSHAQKRDFFKPSQALSINRSCWAAGSYFYSKYRVGRSDTATLTR